MKTKNKDFVSLIVWISALISIGWIIGFFTKNSVNTWYPTLVRSPLTPPNYVFGPVWTVLYTMIAMAGWLIWRSDDQKTIQTIKTLYILQLILNWSWTPIFFTYHLTGAALVCLAVIIVSIALIIVKTYQNMPKVALFLIPYFFWLLLACHLNFYIWLHN